jgi:hypothetical protein
VTPNGDGINDFWFVKDEDHPYCAFNATSFELYIVNVWGGTVWKLVSAAGSCCAFRAPSQDNPIAHSSIYWDGTTNVGFNQGQLVTQGTYYYSLYLHGCGQTSLYSGFIEQLYSPKILNPTDGKIDGKALTLETPQVYGDGELIQAGVAEDKLPENRFFVYPNPTDGLFYIHGGKEIEQVRVFDAQGKMIINKTTNLLEPLNLQPYAPGNYRVNVVFKDQEVKICNIIKQ